MRILFLSFLLAACGTCQADSITVQGTRHDDVYVVDTGGFYQVFGHDGKMTATVSKQRMDVSNVSIDRRDPGRIQFLQQMKDDPGREPKAGNPVPPRRFALRGDPDVAAASLAAHEAAMAAEAAKAKEDQRQREAQLAAEERQSAVYLLMNQAAALPRTATQSSDAAATRQHEDALRDAARAARMSAEAHQETARALREQTMAVEQQTRELRNLRTTERFRQR